MILNRKRGRILIAMALILCLFCSFDLAVWAEEPPEIGSKAAIVMEVSTGAVLYEKNADEQRAPASITKIMTLILIFDELREGNLKLDETVTTSAHARSMTGSKVFLEEGEEQTVDTLIKCIVVSSGNDASVAMAEHIAGTEAAFVERMNERAKSLGMNQTHFEDCCGLTESADHLTTARDIALMSRELLMRYPQITEYSTIWMDTIIHRTRQGEKEFGLANTNKLLKMSTNFRVTGLKTGSTSLAGCCLSASGEQDGIGMIAVVLQAPDYKVRFMEAKNLLDYGFSKCERYEDMEPPVLHNLSVKGGTLKTLSLAYENSFQTVRTDGGDFSSIKKEVNLPELVTAPVKEGDVIGKLVYKMDGTVLGSVRILAAESVEKAEFKDYLEELVQKMICFGMKF